MPADERKIRLAEHGQVMLSVGVSWSLVETRLFVGGSHHAGAASATARMTAEQARQVGLAFFAVAEELDARGGSDG